MSRSEHVEVVQVADGILASLAVPGSAALSNAAVVDLGGITLVFDTHASPQAAMELRAAAASLAGGRPPRLIVFSHDHNDHILGAQVFAEDGVFVASEQTRQMLDDSHEQDLAWANGAPEHIASLQAVIGSASTQAQRDAALARCAYFEALAEMRGQLRVVVPQVGLEGRTVVEGGVHSCDLIIFDRAHAGGDTVLHLPFEGVVFAGDVVSVKTHPFIGDSDPQALLDAVHAIERMRPKVLVPGHGPIGGPEDLESAQAYLVDVGEIARKLIEQGLDTTAGIAAAEIPEPYAEWSQPTVFHSNLRALVARLGGGPAD